MKKYLELFRNYMKLYENLYGKYLSDRNYV